MTNYGLGNLYSCILKSFTFLFLSSVSSLLYGQSSSVFDANYFDSDGQSPPIKAGKGFDIRDVYKQTMYCFTDAYRSNNLKPEDEGQKSSITLHYTKDETEFNELKKNGKSGKVSYLNMFSMGGDKLKEFAQTTLETRERIVFVAKVDFGKYEFETNPVLLPEAQALIDNKNFDEFTDRYGTHYISGVRKGASIFVVLTRKSSSKSTGNNNNSSLDMGANSLFSAVGVNFQITDEESINEQLKSNQFSVSVEINGPGLEKGDLENNISKLLDDDEGDKLAGIKSIIGKVAANMSDPSQGVITQYYYSPFSLFPGMQKINWDAKKENILEQINTKVIDTYATKSKVDKLVGVGALDYLKSEFDNSLGAFNFDEKDQYRQKMISEYNKLLPSLKLDQKTLDNALASLENSYNSCIDIKCDPSIACCLSSGTQDVADMNYKINKDIKQILDIQAEACNAALSAKIKENEIPECEKNQYGTLQIINKSTNPYLIYDNNTYIFTIYGGGDQTMELGIGGHNIKAEQKSGYVLYPTVNYRSVNINKACEGYMVTVGYVD